MDEVGLNLSTARRTRRVASTTSSSKSQSSLADDIHISVIAAISTTDSPVPPFIIYPGGNVMEKWVCLKDDEPKMDRYGHGIGLLKRFYHETVLNRVF